MQHLAGDGGHGVGLAPAPPGRQRRHDAVADEERRDQLPQLLPRGVAPGQRLGERTRVVDERLDLVVEQHEDVAGSRRSPASRWRRPSSRKTIRPSWTTRTMLVLVRSRSGQLGRGDERSLELPGQLRAQRRHLGAHLGDRRLPLGRPSLADGRVGDSSSSWKRMRSSAASAISGLVSHVSALISHSLGPREPKSTRNSFEPVEEGGGVGVVRPTQPVEQPVDAVVELDGERLRVADGSRELPEGVAGLGRVDVADPGQQLHRDGRVADRLPDGEQDAGRDARAAGRHGVALEQLAQHRLRAAGVGDELGVGRRRQVGPPVAPARSCRASRRPTPGTWSS